MCVYIYIWNFFPHGALKNWSEGAGSREGPHPGLLESQFLLNRALPHILYIKFLEHSRYLIYHLIHFVFLSSMHQCADSTFQIYPSYSPLQLGHPKPNFLKLLGFWRSGKHCTKKIKRWWAKIYSHSWTLNSLTYKSTHSKGRIWELVAGYMFLRFVWEKT